MRKGKKPVPPKEAQWKPGQSGNPSGRPKGLLTTSQISATVGRLGMMTTAELTEVYQHPSTSVLDKALANALLLAAESGDCSKLEFLFQRSIGRVKESIEVSTTKPYIIRHPDGSALELGARQAEVINGEVEE